MTQGYYAGISGLQSNQYGIDVLSNNLDNVNTVGFRSYNTEFADLFTQKLVSAGASTPTSNDIGVGSRLQATTMNTQRGSLMNTDRMSDLAIAGNGWFGIVSGTKDYYTRAGSFVFDQVQKTPGDVNSSVARLTTADGMYVTGTMLSNFSYNPAYDYGDLATNGVQGAYVISSSASDVPLAGVGSQGLLEFPTRLAVPAEPTTKTSFYGNLGFQNEVRTMSATAVSATNAHNNLKLTFTQSAVQPPVGISWDILATVTSNDGATTYDTKNGQAIFGPQGTLTSMTLPTMNNDGSPVTVDLGSTFGGVISIDGPPISAASQSNGTSGGTLTNYGIDRNGTIIADFSNGRQSAIGRVAVYHFRNEQGLTRESGTLFSQSSNSGDPVFWKDAAGNTTNGADINSRQLEQSNARLDVGLTDMIILQRAYQANAKTITTVDEMIQKALQMRR